MSCEKNKAKKSLAKKTKGKTSLRKSKTGVSTKKPILPSVPECSGNADTSQTSTRSWRQTVRRGDISGGLSRLPQQDNKQPEVGNGDGTHTIEASPSKQRRKPPIITPIIKEYLKKYPLASTRGLAIIISKNYPEYGFDAENVRSIIRQLRGSHGVKKRKILSKTFYTPQAIEKLRKEEEIELIEMPPTEYDSDWGPYRVTTNRCAILCDIHIPFQSQEALECAIKYCLQYAPDTIILNGDLVDHYNLSEFLKDPRAKDFAFERKCTIQFLIYLRELFPNTRIIWKEGNHEFWYFKYMAKTGGALMNVKYFHIESVYRLEELQIEYVKDNRPIEIMDLWILHGHELQKNAIGVPVNPARSVYLKAATTMLVGHHHITSEHTTQNAKGQITTTWSVGCLSGLRPPYARFSKYNNGLATIDCDHNSRTFHVTNNKIYKGKVI